jgi:hypothetical protein
VDVDREGEKEEREKEEASNGMAALVLNLMWEGIGTRGGSMSGGRIGDSMSEGGRSQQIKAVFLPAPHQTSPTHPSLLLTSISACAAAAAAWYRAA